MQVHLTSDPSLQTLPRISYQLHYRRNMMIGDNHISKPLMFKKTFLLQVSNHLSSHHSRCWTNATILLYLNLEKDNNVSYIIYNTLHKPKDASGTCTSQFKGGSYGSSMPVKPVKFQLVHKYHIVEFKQMLGYMNPRLSKNIAFSCRNKSNQRSVFF